MSVRAALLAALPTASISVKRWDTSLASPVTAVDQLPHEFREHTLVEEPELEDLSRSELVIGHFCLPTLLRVAPPESIAMVLREPRARLISVYAFLRLTPGGDEASRLARVHTARPFDEFLAEPLQAPALDNAVCRMLLYGDPRIPDAHFIPPERIESLACDAVERLEQLGFVGVLERGQATWRGLSRFFGVTLEPTRANVSKATTPEFMPVHEPILDRTLDLLHARTAADALVYRRVLMSETTEVEANRISDATFAAQLVRLGDVAGKSAASAESLTRRVKQTESQIAGLAEQLSMREEELNAQRQTMSRLEEELARQRMWLEGIQRSVSWRMTSPLRAAKRRVLAGEPKSSSRLQVPGSKQP